MDTASFPRMTKSQEDQWSLGSRIFQIYDHFAKLHPNSKPLMLELQRDNHIQYLTKGLRKLGSSFCVLDANRPWLCYWILHSLALLRESVDAELEYGAIDFLSRCQDRDGGYGGGPGQMPHLATTYAAVNSLITLGGHRSLSSIERDKIKSFLLRMKHTSGGFRMHDGGEIDVRACYTAIAVASVLNILDSNLVQKVGDYILSSVRLQIPPTLWSQIASISSHPGKTVVLNSCQTYEGGIAGEPGSEAHGGYTFCGLATMILINEVNRLDLTSLTDWLVFRQGLEGGFQGRTNKLVDGCYSFWQGCSVVLIQRFHTISGEGYCNACSSTENSEASDLSTDEDCLEGTSYADDTSHNREEGQQIIPDKVKSCHLEVKRRAETEPLFQSIALQQYILLCSQVEGGFRDKPGKDRDHYHTCYCLSGLSGAQYSCSEDDRTPPLPSAVLGPYSNLLEPINPLFGLVLDRYNEAREFFGTLSEAY